MKKAVSFPLDEWDVVVGRVKGRWDHSRLRIVPFVETKGRFSAKDAPLCLAPKSGERVLLHVREAYRKDNCWICDFAIPTSEEADSYVGADVLIHASMRPKLPEGEFYPDEILGMTMKSVDGEELGEIEEILDSPAHEIYVSEGISVPAVPNFIARVDGENRVVWVQNVEALRE